MSKTLPALSIALFLLTFYTHSESLKLGSDLSDGVVFESAKEELITNKGIRFSVRAIDDKIISFDDFIESVYRSLPSWYLDGAKKSTDINHCLFKLNEKRLETYISEWYWHHHLEPNSVVINELKSDGITSNLQQDFMMFSICQRIKDDAKSSSKQYIKKYDKLLLEELGVDVIK